jgi:hypothetical protein
MPLRIARRLLALGGFGAALFISACTSSTGVDRFALEELQVNQQIWLNSGPPQAYTMRVTRASPSDPTPRAVRVQVAGGQVASVVYDDTQEAVPDAVRALHRTVDGLYALIREAINGGVQELLVSYDLVYGYPQEIRIQYDRTRLGEYLAINVSQFAITDAGS